MLLKQRYLSTWELELPVQVLFLIYVNCCDKPSYILLGQYISTRNCCLFSVNYPSCVLLGQYTSINILFSALEETFLFSDHQLTKMLMLYHHHYHHASPLFSDVGQDIKSKGKEVL